MTGLSIERRSRENKRGSILILGITVNVLILIYFKYLNFFLSGLYSLFGVEFYVNSAGNGPGFPVGISFYTFVAISYIIDIYRKNGRAFKNIADTALSFSMFPKLLSGPITLHSKFSPQLSLNREYVFDFDAGVKRLITGLGKKVLLADYLLKTSDSIFLIPYGQLTSGLAWLGAVTYTLALYLDFSGYTDIAIGIGKILGYDIPENFNFPYISRSIREFWKRWHITLSEWLQTYLFLPIAYAIMRRIEGERFLGFKTENIAYISASFFTMVICGLWHGAAWTFVLWGTFHGMMLVIEHLFLKKFLKKRKYFYIQWIYAQLGIIIGWVIFRSENIAQIKDFLFSMFGFGSGTGEKYYSALYTDPEFVTIFIIGLAISFPLAKKLKTGLSKYRGFSPALIKHSEYVFLILILILSVMTISTGTYSPFIYFRF